MNRSKSLSRTTSVLAFAVFAILAIGGTAAVLKKSKQRKPWAGSPSWTRSR